MFQLNCDKIAELFIFILKISFSTKLSENFVVTIQIKDNEIKNSDNDDKTDKINKF